MQKLATIFYFYKPFLFWSFGISIFLFILLGNYISLVILGKIFLILFLAYVVNESSFKQKLIFYKNLGISTFKLFFVFFIIDAILTMSILSIIKGFI
ncbi:hypothetical protein CSW08_05080 [Confluentibacter flavum]|uniref:Uncharacterized protein n=1 Tax=Confluentibacter flavum TaxID=1909700 RepID=A0A2N3HMC0_9FLAO|nr:hypothetical protein CSW08_05080 [Confluentibacter flavum]